MAVYRSQISSKGQIVIPAELREQMQLKPGTQVVIERHGLEIVMRPVTPEFIRSLRGISAGKNLEAIRDREHRKDRY